ncbi:MAG: hypothetical protein RIK87_15170 [Fuerstiella sp.]
MSNKKPIPLFETAPRSNCPVCGETSYSAAGIHPQCAVRRADQERMQRRTFNVVDDVVDNADDNAVDDATDELTRPTGSVSPAAAHCPKCDAAQFGPWKCCSCGYVFFMDSRVPQNEGT